MHHANLLIGEKDQALLCIPQSLQNAGVDITHYTYERMNIGDARSLIREILLKPISLEKNTFVISAQSILVEAQNALLKMFEEPNAHTVFYLIVPREDVLLPTLRSRLNLIDVEREAVDMGFFEIFIKAGYSERLAQIAEKLKDEDFDWVRSIMRGAEQYVQNMKQKEQIRDVLMVDTYLESTGSSKKMLLEHLALTL
jgi:hypothetical protein